MRFDAQAAAALHAPPEVLLPDGRVVVGRPLSAAQFVRVAAGYDAARVSGSLVAWMQWARLLLTAMFPRRGWRDYLRPSVADVLLAQPPAVWQAACASFFGSLATPTPATTTETATTTAGDDAPQDGTDSPPTS